jgi:hypothetical protein
MWASVPQILKRLLNFTIHEPGVHGSRGNVFVAESILHHLQAVRGPEKIAGQGVTEKMGVQVFVDPRFLPQPFDPTPEPAPA